MHTETEHTSGESTAEAFLPTRRRMFALLRHGVDSLARDQSLAQTRFFSREEVQFCDKHCEKYVNAWEANNHIYGERGIHVRSIGIVSDFRST